MTIPVGFNQLTSFTSAAVGLGKGLNSVATAAINAAGSGYSVGQFVSVSGGTAQYAAQAQITQVDANGVLTGTVGAVMAVQLVIPGVYTSNPSATGCATTLNSHQGGSGTGLTLNLTFNADVVPWNAKWAEVTVEAQNVRLRDDGADPTSTVGQLLTVNSQGVPPMKVPRPFQTRVIGATSGAIMNVTFYGFRRYQ